MRHYITMDPMGIEAFKGSAATGGWIATERDGLTFLQADPGREVGPLRRRGDHCGFTAGEDVDLIDLLLATGSRMDADRDVQAALGEQRQGLVAVMSEPCVTTSVKLVIDGDGCDGHLGGAARLPIGTEWPTTSTGRDLSFVAEFDADLIATHGVSVPPGRIALFYETELQPWGNPMDPMGTDLSRTGHRVVFVPDGVGTAEISRGIAYGRHPLKAMVVSAFDAGELDRLMNDGEHLRDDGDPSEAMEAARDRAIVAEHELRAGRHSAITTTGPVDVVQGPMEWSCTISFQQIHGIETTETDWICIAQVESLQQCPAFPLGLTDSWMWGDFGVLYFWITREDLNAMRFDRTLCVLQCH